MPGNFSTEPIAGGERAPLGQDPFNRPVFNLTPLEPNNGALLLPDGCFFLLPDGCFLEQP